MADSRTLILSSPTPSSAGSPGRSSPASSARGCAITQLRLLTADEEIANAHYAEHSEKPFFGELV